MVVKPDERMRAGGAVYVMARAGVDLLNKADYGNAVCSCNGASRLRSEC